MERIFHADWEHVCILSNIFAAYKDPKEWRIQRLAFHRVCTSWQHVDFHDFPEATIPLLTQGTSDSPILYGYGEQQVSRIQWGPLPDNTAWLEVTCLPETPKIWVLRYVIPEGGSPEPILDEALQLMLDKRPLKP